MKPSSWAPASSGTCVVSLGSGHGPSRAGLGRGAGGGGRGRCGGGGRSRDRPGRAAREAGVAGVAGVAHLCCQLGKLRCEPGSRFLGREAGVVPGGDRGGRGGGGRRVSLSGCSGDPVASPPAGRSPSGVGVGGGASPRIPGPGRPRDSVSTLGSHHTLGRGFASAVTHRSPAEATEPGPPTEEALLLLSFQGTGSATLRGSAW